MPQMTEQDRHDQLVRLNEQFIDQNKKLFKSNAKEFAKLRAGFQKDISGLSPVLQEQFETLKDISDDAQIAGAKGQKELLKKTENTISVLKTLAKTDSADSQNIKDMLRSAKTQEKLLKQNISIIDSGLSAVKGAAADTLAIAVGVLSESPILGIGIKAIGDFFGGIRDRRQEKKESQAEAVLSALKSSRQDISSVESSVTKAMESIDADFSDSTETYAQAIAKTMQDIDDDFSDTTEKYAKSVADSVKKQEKVLTVQKKWYDRSASGGMGLAGSFQETGPLQVIPVDSSGTPFVMAGSASGAAGGAGGPEEESANLMLQAQFAQLEEANRILEGIAHDTRWNRKYNFLQMKFVGDQLGALAGWMFSWFKNKQEELLAKRITSVVEKLSGALLGKLDQARKEGMTLRHTIFEDRQVMTGFGNVAQTQRNKAIDLWDRILNLNVHYYDIIENIKYFPKLFGFIRDNTEETVERLDEILGVLNGKIAVNTSETNDNLEILRANGTWAKSRQAEKDREDDEKQRDLLEVLGKIGEDKNIPEEDESMAEGLVAGSMAGLMSALLKGLKFAVVLTAIGAMAYKIFTGAVKYLADHPGEYFNAALAGFADLGNTLMNSAIKIVEFFGADLSAIHQDKREAWASKTGLLIDEWFADLFDGIEKFFVDLLPESVQEKLGIGKFKRNTEEGHVQFSKIPDAVKFNDDLSQEVDLQKVARTLDAQQLDELINAPTTIIDHQQVTLTEEMIEVLEEIRDKKLELMAGKIKKSELDKLYNKAGVMRIEAPETPIEIMSRIGDSIVGAFRTLTGAVDTMGTYQDANDPELVKSNNSTRQKLENVNHLNENRQREREERLNQQNATGNIAINAPKSVSSNTNIIQTSSPYQTDTLLNRIDMNNLAP